MSARALAWAWRQEPKSSSQKLVLAALADRADDDGECFPSVDWIAEKCAPMAPESVRRNIRELTEQGFVQKVERNRRDDGTLGTWNYRLPISDESTGHERPVEPPVASERADLDLPDGRSEAKASEGPKAQGIRLITSTWFQFSPPLIRHRQRYLDAKGTQACIERAMRVYEPEVIAEAVRNYAAVLGEDEYRWDYSWTICDFLKRGLDRFVPEARPLENFRRRDGEKFGRRDVSAAEFGDLAERLREEEESAAIRGERPAEAIEGSLPAHDPG